LRPVELPLAASTILAGSKLRLGGLAGRRNALRLLRPTQLALWVS